MESLASGTVTGAAVSVNEALRRMSKLLTGLDEIGLGAISDESARAEARGRKKRIASALEDELIPAATSLQARVQSQGEARAADVDTTSARPAGASAEIDSDED